MLTKITTTSDYTYPLSKGRRIQRRIDYHGIPISIETDKGQVRHWWDPNANEHGTTKMHYPYGYVRRTEGMDDEQVDCYVNEHGNSDKVFVITQLKKPDFTEKDEEKCFFGFSTEKEAKAAYLDHYDDPRFFGSIRELSIESFKDKYINKAINSQGMGAIPGQMPMQGTPGMPGMPIGMGPMGPMMMGPPPIDVETLEGVEALLGRIGSMKDKELLNVSEKIWGSGYQWIQATIETVRMEIIGFLLDQRDLLGIDMMTGTMTSQTQNSNPFSTVAPSGSENSSQPLTNEQGQENPFDQVISGSGGLTEGSSMNSPNEVSSPNQKGNSNPFANIASAKQVYAG